MRPRPVHGQVALPALAAAVILAVLAACGSGRSDGEPGPPPPPPDLTGSRVMLIPARPGEPPELDRELEFWLTDRAPGIGWVLPAEIRRAIERTPAAGFNLAAPRPIVEVRRGDRRVGDPLYGDLRRLGALVGADLALVPLGTRVSADSLGTSVALTAALVAIRGGHVLWLHTVVGGPAATEATGLASAAETLARTLIPGEG